MYKVLDIDVNGMNSIKFLKSPDSETKWVLDTDLEHIFMTDEAQIDTTQDNHLQFFTSKGQNVNYFVQPLIMIELRLK